MDIKEFLFQSFLEWQKVSGERRTVTEWAKYLDVPQASLSSWMNGAYQPKGVNLAKLANKLGPDVYEVLGMPRPILAEEEKDPSFREWMQIFRNANDDKRQELLKKVRPDTKVSHEARP